MTSSVPTPAEILDSFPETPTRIDGIPTYNTLKTLRDSLKTNAAAIDTMIGGGIYGHLGLILPPAIYDTIVPPAHPGQHAWVDPVNPGLFPAFPPQATDTEREQIKTNHNELKRLWKLCNNVNAALRIQILNAVDEIYLRAIKHRHTGFSTVKARDLLSHMFTHYGKITPQALVANNKLFTQDWDPTTPFETLIDQIESAQEFALDGGQPYSNRQILTNAYHLVYQTGLYFEDCKRWMEKPPQEHTWDNFKTHILAAQDQLRLQQTAQQKGYYGRFFDKHIEEQCLKIEQATNAFLEASQQKEEDLSTLSASQAAYTAQNNKIEELLTNLTNRLDNLERKRNPPSRAPRKDHGGYCWTHGYLVPPNHTSLTCRKRKPGHQEAATRDNNMGGSQAGKPS